MTISQSGATGVTTATAARGTTSTTVAYVGVAAGRLAFIFAQVKPETATFGTVSGWTSLGSFPGGTGATGADVGQSRIGVWYKDLTGSESGSVTVTATGSSEITAVMQTLNKTRSAWRTPVVVSGSDSTHGTNLSAVLGAWGETLTASDWVLIGHSSDTDNTSAISAPTLTQTGASFGTVTAVNRLGNSDGDDGIVTSWRASVSSGSANAPTFGFTWAASSCGPVVAVRVHEYDPISTLTDNFDDNALTNPPWSANYGTHSETGGRARVDCITTFSGYQTGYFYAWDGQFSVEVPTMPSQGGATTECYAAAWVVDAIQGSGNDVGFQLNRITGTLRFMSRTSFDEVGAPSVTIDPVAHRWWRLRTVSTNLLWETSPNGIDWTTQRTLAQPSWLTNTQNSKVLLECHRNNGTADFAEFDNVNILPSLVSSAIDLRWAVEASATPVSSALDLRWTSYAQVSATLDLRWAVASSVSKALDLRWDVYQPVSAALDTRWAVLSTVSAGMDLRWLVRSGVASGLEVRWLVRNAISAPLDLRWAVRGTVSAPLDLRWDSYEAVQASLDLLWALRNLVSAPVDLRWTQFALVSAPLDLRWASEGRVRSSIGLLWRTHNLVAGTLDVRWAVSVGVSAPIGLLWVVRGTATRSLELLWVSDGEVVTVPADVVATLTDRLRSTPELADVYYGAAPRVAVNLRDQV